MDLRMPFINKRSAQLIIVLLAAAVLKVHYSTASVNELQWVLAPTAFLAELTTGTRFEFESYAGYMSSDRSFLIAASCSGVNFLITAFLMLSLGKLWRCGSQNIKWRFIPAAALVAYLTTIVANTARISAALLLRQTDQEMIWLNPEQLHRFEGIFIYFGFLLMLFIVSEMRSTDNPASLFRRSFFPLLAYYAMTLGIPLANGAYRQGADFWEYSLFVFLTPLFMILPLAALGSNLGAATRTIRQQQSHPHAYRIHRCP